MKSEVKISIIIPNLNSLIIDRTIQSILEQKTTYPFEIIVIGSDKYKKVKAFGDKVIHIETSRPQPPGINRNVGAESATGDIFLFIDSDCVASPLWVEKHLSIHLKKEELVIVGGGVTFPSKNYFTLTDNISSFHEFMTHIQNGEKKYLPSLNLSVSKEAWSIIGEFSDFSASEDIEFTMRALGNGISLFFEPEAAITHLPNRTKIKELLHHAFFHGNFTLKGNRDFWEKMDTPAIMRHWWLTLIFSPLLSAYVLFKMVFLEKLPIKYWHTLPVIYLLKITWCIGLVKQLKAQKG